MKFKIYHFYSIIILLLLAPIILSAQSKQANNWFFGEYAGLTFNTGSPPAVLLNGQINSDNYKGTACISSQNGDLLFYSDGVTVWNNNHQVMVNGTYMGNTTLQGGLFVKTPGSNSIYYFFNFNTDNNLHQLQYSVVDASLYGGSVVQGQKCIILHSNTTSHLNAVRHANGQDIWVLTHASGSNIFYAFLLTNDGVNSTPVISAVGPGYSEEGYLKFSSDGRWVASANPHETGKSQLYRFNNATGQLFNDFVMDFPVDATGVEFSPNNKMLYVNGGSQLIRQYDLTMAYPNQILLSEFIVSHVSYGAMQLGADGKIYLTSSGNSLAVIYYPNRKGLFCDFHADAIDLTRNCRMSFPNFMQSYFGDPYFTTVQHCFGMPTEFIIGNTEGIDSVHWKFNDLGNFPFDTSTLLNPSYTYSAPGNYYSELTVVSGFISKTIYDTVVIYPSPSPELGNDTMFCLGESINISLDAGPGDQYFWNSSLTPEQASTFQVNSTGIYWVKVIENGCSGYDTIVIGSYPQPIIYYITVTHDICNTGSGTITVIPESGDPDDYWYSLDGGINFVQNGGFFTNLNPGVYVAWIRNEAGCVSGSMPIIIASIVCPENVVVFPDLTNTPQNEGMAVITPPGGGPYTVLVDGISRIVENDTITGLSQGSHSIVITNLSGMDFTFMVNIEGVLGLEENSDADNFSIHHDNSSNRIYLDFGKVVLSGNAYAEIRNTNGLLLSVHSIQTPRTEISLADIPKGVYIITVLSDKGMRSIKFVR